MTRTYKTLEELFPHLPKHSHSITGAPMEPISLIIVGHKQALKDSFMKYGWYQADRLNLLSIVRAMIAGLFNTSYRTGPFSSSFIHKAPQLGFEKPTNADTFRRRHHVRLWRTGYRLNHQPVWVGTVSYDRAIGVQKNHIIPTHHISPDLAEDLRLLSRDFTELRPGYFKLGHAERGVINNGDKYSWDGRALVINFSHET